MSWVRGLGRLDFNPGYPALLEPQIRTEGESRRVWWYIYLPILWGFGIKLIISEVMIYHARYPGELEMTLQISNVVGRETGILPVLHFVVYRCSIGLSPGVLWLPFIIRLPPPLSLIELRGPSPSSWTLFHPPSAEVPLFNPTHLIHV